MSVAVDSLRTINFAPPEAAQFDDSIRRDCEVLGLDIDSLAIAPTNLVEAAIGFARATITAGMAEYYQDSAAALRIPESEVTQKLGRHLERVAPTVDGAAVDEAIQSLAKDAADAECYAEQAKAIIKFCLFNANLKTTEAMLAITRSDPAAREKAAEVFGVFGFELQGLAGGSSAVTEQQPIVPVRASHHRANRLIATVVATAALTSVAGPAVAADRGDQSGQERPIISVQADGQVTAAAPVSPEASPSAVATPQPVAPQTPSIEASLAPSQTASPEVTSPETAPKPAPAVTETPTAATAPNTPKPTATAPPASTPETPPSTDDSNTAAENQKIAEKLQPTYIEVLKGELVRVQKVLQTGNLNDLAHGTTDIFATKDPAHPAKLLPMLINTAQKEQLAAQYDLIQGVLANDPEIMQIVTSYFAANPLPDKMAEAVAFDVQQLKFTEKGQPDLLPEQKMNLLILLQDLTTPLIATANADIKTATDAYNAAQAAEKAKQAREKASSNEQYSTNPYGLGEVWIVDRQDFIARANAWIHSKAPSSPMNGMAKDFLTGAEENNVSVGVLTVGADLESQFCSDKGSVCVTHQTYNAWNRECPSDKPSITYQDGVSGFHHRACAYLSFKDSLLRNDYRGPMAPHHGFDSMGQFVHRKFIEHGINDVPGMLGEFTPAHEVGAAQHTKIVKIWLAQMDDFWQAMGDSVSFKPVAKHVTAEAPKTHNGKFTDSKTIEIPNANEALAMGASLVKLTNRAIQTGDVNSFKRACPRDDPEHRCSNLCDHIAAYLWGNEHSGYPSARLHRIEMADENRLHTGADKYEPAIGAFMFWGTRGFGHAAIYAGNGMIYSTSIYDKKNGLDGGVYLAKATDITKLWGLPYTGWANDPGLSHAKSVVS